MANAPGKSDREGMTILELMQKFPTEDAARELVRAADLAEWPLLPALRFHGDLREPSQRKPPLSL